MLRALLANARDNDMDAIFLQILNGLDKGGAYALIALGLTLVFGTLGVVNFAHGALFMMGAFCAVTLQRIFNISYEVVSATKTDFLGKPLKEQIPYLKGIFGEDVGGFMVDFSVPLSIILAIIVMGIVGVVMERGLIKHFYKRPHADQILVTFGLAIVIGELIRHYYGANPIPQSAPKMVSGSANIGEWIGLGSKCNLPLVAFGLFRVLCNRNIWCFCFPPVYNIWHGCARWNAGSGDGWAFGHKYRTEIHHRVCPCGDCRRGCWRDVHPNFTT